MTQEQGKIYDDFYYRTGCGLPYERTEHWLRLFDNIAERIIRDINPRTVLDAGCAMGFLVEALRKRGVEAYGVDISEYAIQNVHPDIRPYCWVGSIAEPFPQHYDLIVTIEVLEHIPKLEAERVVANLCNHADDVLFSSGDEDLREVTHINVQPAEYWASLFASSQFFRDVDFDGTFITSWTVRFRRMNEPVHYIIMDYERQINRLVQENAAVRQVNLEQKDRLAQMERELTGMHRQLGELYATKTYQVARRMRFLVPAGSRREKLISGLWDWLSSFRRRASLH
jgi:SAM-dependent methyltransferase